MNHYIIISALFTALIGYTSVGYTQEAYRISSGTGFFVTKDYVITNEHVVQNCQQIFVRGDLQVAGAIPRVPAQLIAIDKENDLALLKTAEDSSRISVLRANTGIKVGDKIMVIGYPKEHGQTGIYFLAKGNITKVDGEFNYERRVEFTDAVRQGNSGGPLLDSNGNVIGVIVGILSTYASEEDKVKDVPIQRNGVAISLAQLKNFLKKHNVFYRLSNTYGKIPDNRLEESAKRMIVNVHCVLGKAE